MVGFLSLLSKNPRICVTTCLFYLKTSSFSGSPRPQIAWSKDNVIIHSGDDNSRIRLKEAGSLLVIKDVRYSDHGKVKFLGYNSSGKHL